MSFDPVRALYERLRGPAGRQVWHEADVDGYHFYFADTSFGDGPIFSVVGHGHYHGFECPMGEFLPMTKDTTLADLDWIIPLTERAEWVDKLAENQRKMGYQP
jgi:hypothetical protein